MLFYATVVIFLTMQSCVCMVRAYPQSLNQTAAGSEEGIVFPDQKLTVPRIGNESPKCAKGKTFCEDIEGYPVEQISQLIQKESTLYKSLFGTDVQVPEVVNRIFPEEELCKYDEHIAYPKVGKNKDDKWAWIANTKDFQQGVRVEVCQSVNSACGFDGFLPIGYTNSCVQKYVTRRLLSIQPNGTLYVDTFWFPSCCACKIYSGMFK